jgi:hypothetical protein
MRDKFFLPIELNAPATVAARGALGIDIDLGIAKTIGATRTAEHKKGPALQLSRIFVLWPRVDYSVLVASKGIRGDQGWRYRWCVTRGGNWNRLHRVVSGVTVNKNYVGVKKAKTLCGLTGEFQMPGIFSRMGLRRCANCCRIAGLPTGKGAPANVFKDRRQFL